MEIDNVDLIKSDDIINKKLSINDINGTPLDEVYKEKNINRITINKVTDAKLKNELTFNIKSDIDSPSLNERNYKIKLNNEDGIEIDATCTLPIMNILEDKTINCNSPKDNVNKKLTFVQGIYESNESEKDLLIVNDNDITIEVTKFKGLSVLAIIGITIAGIIIIGPFIFYLIRFFLKKNDNDNNDNFYGDDRFEGRGGNNGDNCKEVIFR